jgi:hypothetical protein
VARDVKALHPVAAHVDEQPQTGRILNTFGDDLQPE